MEKQRPELSEYIYAAGLSAAFIPAAAAVCCFAQKKERIPSETLIFLLVSFAAFMLCRLIKSPSCKKERFLQKLTAFFAAAAVFAVSYDFPLFFRTVLAVLPVICLLLLTADDDTAGTYIFTGVSFAEVLISFVMSYSFPEIPVSACTVPYSFYCFCYLFRKNQNAVTRLLTRRNLSRLRIPKKNYRYNAFLMLFPGLMIGLFLLASFPLSEVFSFIAKTLLRKLFSLFGNGNNTAPEPSYDSSGEQLPIKYAEISHSNVLRYIITAALTGAAVFLVYFLRREIAELAFRTARRIKLRCTEVPQDEKNEQYDGYYDTVILLDDDSEPYQKKKKNSVRRWKKEYKAYLSMEDGREKYLAGIALIQQAAVLSGERIMPCETVYDIEKKIGSPLWKSAADSYCKIKYSDMACCSESPEKLNLILQEYRIRF
ncbi:MAG: hypothetical protein ACI4I9_04835 [Porcipelethomonas sp.]